MRNQRKKEEPRRRNRLPGLVLAAVLAATALPARGGQEGDPRYFHFYELEFPGTRHDRTVVDLDGDGLLDLVMVYSLSNVRDQYFLRTCLQDRAKGFAKDACREMKMPEQVRAFDIGNIDKSQAAELVALTDDGVKAASFKDGGFGKLASLSPAHTILTGTEKDKPALLRFLWDTDGDGIKELVIPAEQGPAVYRKQEEQTLLVQKINSPARITYRVGSLGDIMNTDDVNQFLRFRKYMQRVTAHYTAPDIFIVDYDGDGKKDVVTLVANRLKVFRQTDKDRFSEKPDLSLEMSILPPEEKTSGLAGEAMTFEDLNGDGIMDIIMLKWGTSQERTQIDRYIYFGRKGLKYPPADKPDQIVRSESAAIDFGIYDLNRDGKLDLVIPFFHFAPAQAFKVMTENAIKVQFRIFLMNPEGRYSQDPGKRFAKVDRRVLLNYKIDILGLIFDFRTLLEGKFFPLISFGHDFNGDGYPDLVADTGGDRLQFFYGNKEVNYPNQPDLVFDFESSTDFDLVDLNQDGKCDLVAYYESEERTKKKRELAKKARSSQADTSSVETIMEEAEKMTPEGTRIKILISK